MSPLRRPSHSILASLAVALGALFTPTSAHAADEPPPPPSAAPAPPLDGGPRGRVGNGQLGVEASQTQFVTAVISGSDGRSYAGGSPQQARVATTRTELRAACAGASGDVAFCGRVTATACGGDPTSTAYQARTVTLSSGAATDWSLVCISAQDAAGNPVAAPVFTLQQVYAAVQQEFRSITPATGGAGVQPEGRALLNYPAIFFATEPAPPTIATDGLLFGVLPFTLEGRPVRHDWVVDGGAATVADTHQGRPWTESERVRQSDGSVGEYYVGYTFRSSGTHDVALQTTWGGSATVAGFGTFPLPGTVTSTGPATEFEVRGARSELVR